MPSPLQALLDRYLPAIEAGLRDLLAAEGPPYSDFYNMLHYHMGWVDVDLNPDQGQAGKRVRPVLCLLAAEAAGGTLEQVLPAALGIELLHNFSLIHDDIEDESDTRRGRPTLWKLWGQAQAINAGDGMFALAHLAFARLPAHGVPVERAFAASRVFKETCLDLTHGQYLDMCFEDRLDVTAAEYLTMIEGKTAKLIAASTYLGAVLSGADATSAGHFFQLGFHLGMAFQVQDDILGIWGDTDVTGKSTSTDIQTQKKTLPVVLGLERSPELRQLYRGDSITPTQVPRIVKTLTQIGAREMAESLANEHHQKAMSALERTGAIGQAREALQELATKLLTRAS